MKKQYFNNSSGAPVLFIFIFLSVLMLMGILFADTNSKFHLQLLKETKITMNGHYGDENTPALYTVTSEKCGADQCFRAVWDTKVMKNNMLFKANGEPVYTKHRRLKDNIEVEIEYTRDGAIYKYTKDGKTKTTEIRQKGLAEVLAIDVLLLSYPFESGKEMVFYGIDADSEGGDVYRFCANLKEVETIIIGGKKTRAYKIEFGLKGVLSLFAPTFYFWYSFDKPHTYLKYEGPEESFTLVSGRMGL